MTLPSWRVSTGLRTEATATWLFVLAFLAVRVGRHHAYIELIGLAVLALASYADRRRPVPPRAIRRIVLTAAILTLITCSYLIFGSWPSAFGTTRSYDTHAVYFVAAYLGVCAFAVLFFDERLFERVDRKSVV